MVLSPPCSVCIWTADQSKGRTAGEDGWGHQGKSDRGKGEWPVWEPTDPFCYFLPGQGKSVIGLTYTLVFQFSRLPKLFTNQIQSYIVTVMYGLICRYRTLQIRATLTANRQFCKAGKPPRFVAAAVLNVLQNETVSSAVIQTTALPPALLFLILGCDSGQRGLRAMLGLAMTGSERSCGRPGSRTQEPHWPQSRWRREEATVGPVAEPGNSVRLSGGREQQEAWLQLWRAVGHEGEGIPPPHPQALQVYYTFPV